MRERGRGSARELMSLPVFPLAPDTAVIHERALAAALALSEPVPARSLSCLLFLVHSRVPALETYCVSDGGEGGEDERMGGEGRLAVSTRFILHYTDRHTSTTGFWVAAVRMCVLHAMQEAIHALSHRQAAGTRC